MQNKVIFPKEPNVSQACRSLISRILVPQRIRLDIDRIRNDVWLSMSLVTAQTSTTDILTVRFEILSYVALMVNDILYIILKDISVVRNIRKTALERFSGTFKGTKKHSTDIGAQIIDVRSSDLSISDENNNRYRRNLK